jgi:hypothetical protein
MDAQLIRIGTRIVNPTHIAYAEWIDTAQLALHMAVCVPYGDSRSGTSTGHAVIIATEEDAAAVWKALCALAGGK